MSLRVAGVAAGAAGAGTVVLAVTLIAWLAIVAGASVGPSPSAGCAATNLAAGVPAELRPIFGAASEKYRLGEKGPSILAGLTSVESGFGQNMGPSSAGATGWTQFLPSTWAAYGVDADGDGRRDPYNAKDAIYSAANYLSDSGAPQDWHRALFTYNHANWYVEKVLREAERLRTAGRATPCAPAAMPSVGATQKIVGGGRIVGIPGFPGERIDERLLPDLLYLIRKYRLHVTDGYATSGHAADGEHPLGLGVDLVPGPGGTWDDIDQLVRWAEPVQGRPRRPFRWVGYDGDANHGRGHHLHLSWDHAPVPSQTPPAAWVEVFARG
jgi:hypothetical protein